MKKHKDLVSLRTFSIALCFLHPARVKVTHLKMKDKSKRLHRKKQKLALRRIKLLIQAIIPPKTIAIIVKVAHNPSMTTYKP